MLVMAAMLVGLGAVGCKSSKKTAASSATTSAASAATDPAQILKRVDPSEYANEVVLRLERTACFGTCPVFTMVIFEDGTGWYEGRTHATPEGKHTFSGIDVAGLLAQAKEINYMGLEDEYVTPVTDFPTCYTYVRLGKDRKQIRDYRGAPPELKAFEKKIEEAVFGVKMTRAE